ncbi:hypothetical protein LSH36_229g04053 [Paralvinella palmiformis]|uniref:Protein trunk n=1 Tax=Paralvinella palmiformis TaxID=53620 RepID=A0AAD9N3Z8_9ANNE|nr:hypothetical protein LSH36_229g04053 [Paralvinella palmiformis]
MPKLDPECLGSPDQSLVQKSRHAFTVDDQSHFRFRLLFRAFSVGYDPESCRIGSASSSRFIREPWTRPVSEASCLLFIGIAFRILMLVNCRPHTELPLGDAPHPPSSRRQDGGGGGNSSRRMLTCEEVSKRQLWIRLDRVQYRERSTDGIGLDLKPSPVAPIIDSPTLKHPDTALATHSRRALRHRTHSRTEANASRRRRRRRRQTTSKRIRKRATRARKKFLKRLARTRDAKKIERILMRGEARWRCTFQERWIQLGDDYFPEYVRTGSCLQNDCMFGFYQCRERTYQLPVLRRDRLNCNVIPSLDPDTVYEEAWLEDHVEVVVGCECRPFGMS